MTEKKIYIFGTEAIAEGFQRTAEYFGYDIKRIGSALVMQPETYESVIENTHTANAALVAQIE